MDGERRESDQTMEPRPARSLWVWRGFFLLSLVAAAIAVLLADNGAGSYAILWGVIAAGWFAISIWLRRMHSQMVEQEARWGRSPVGRPAKSRAGQVRRRDR